MGDWARSVLTLLYFIKLCIIPSHSISTMSIDLGNDCSKIAVVLPGVPMEIALDSASERKIPTITVLKKDRRLFGGAALSSAKRDPLSAFVELPSLIGKKIDHPTVVEYRKRYPYYSLAYNETNGLLAFNYNDQKFTVEELLAMYLKHMKEVAEVFSNTSMNTAVITVPSHFTQAERISLLRTAKLAEIEVLQLMNSNAAIALNYGVFRRSSFTLNPQYYIFCDVGIIATTATVVSYQIAKGREGDRMEENPHAFILGVGSDQSLGTNAFIDRLFVHLLNSFKAAKGKHLKSEVMNNPRAISKLRTEATRIFKILSANPEIRAIVENVQDDQELNLRVTRNELEDMCADLLPRVKATLSTAVEAANIGLAYVKEVILFGGGSRVPMVQTAIKEATKKKELGKGINSDEAAALGAVYQAAYHTPGFRVKRFVAKDINRFPILVQFPRIPKDDGEGAAEIATMTSGEGEEPKDAIVTRTLFQVGNPCPQRRSITFNRLKHDMNFSVTYGEISGNLKSYTNDKMELMMVSLTQVAKKQANFSDYSPRGVKAHFYLDYSCILRLTEVNLILDLVNDTTEADESESTFQKLKDGISNFFGSSSDTASTLDDDGNSSKPSETGSATANVSTTAINSTESLNFTTPDGNDSSISPPSSKSSPPKKRTYLEPLSFDVKLFDAAVPSEEDLFASMRLLRELEAADRERRELERLRNKLESDIYENREKLSGSSFLRHSTEEERAAIQKAIAVSADWFEEEGFSATKKDFEHQLAQLSAPIEHLEKRIQAHQEVPVALSKLVEFMANADKMSNLMRAFQISSPNPVVDDAAKLAVLNNKSEVDQLSAEEASSISTSSEEPGTVKTEAKSAPELPVFNQIFTAKEVELFEQLVNSTQSWLDNSAAALKEADPTKLPPFSVLDVANRLHSVAESVHFYSGKLDNWRAAAELSRREAERKAKEAANMAIDSVMASKESSAAATDASATSSTPTESEATTGRRPSVETPAPEAADSTPRSDL